MTATPPADRPDLRQEDYDRTARALYGSEGDCTPPRRASWSGPCGKCGHPSSYHGMTFCTVMAGSTDKRRCDCDGYGVRDPRCECGWMGNGVNHYHDTRMGKAHRD